MGGKIFPLGKERIRRSIKLLETNRKQQTLDDNNKNLDFGLRVFKVDSSNMKNIYYSPEKISQFKLDDLIDNVKEDRTPMDLLIQTMIECSIPLSAPISEKEIAGKKVFTVNNGELVACFDKEITEEVVTFIAKNATTYAVIRDVSMDSDSTATNFEQIFKTYNPNVERKVI